MSRIVFHIDVNSAFLSWSALERLEQNPDSIDLRTIPSAVAGDVASRRGVVTAASIPAKRLGVKSGEPVSAALRLCPNLVLVASNFSYYRRKSVAFLEILNRHSPAVEQFSIDEAFLDMSARFSDRRREEAAIRACAAAIQTEIRETLGFTVNVGISENKLLAKMASDFEKPDKIHTLWPEELSAKFYPLPIRSLFGVGGQSAEKLLRFGIHTIGEAADTPCEVLQRILGPSAGKSVYQSARGINHSAVRRERPQAKSHSVERTTTTDIEKRNAATELPPLLSELAEELSSRLRKANVRAVNLRDIPRLDAVERRAEGTLSLVAGHVETASPGAYVIAHKVINRCVHRRFLPVSVCICSCFCPLQMRLRYSERLKRHSIICDSEISAVLYLPDISPGLAALGRVVSPVPYQSSALCCSFCSGTACAFCVSLCAAESSAPPRSKALSP